MYVKSALFLNNGPIEEFLLQPGFHENGNPKPVIIVGGNGSGKTSILSVIADSIIEIAAAHYNNVTIHDGGARKFFRVIGLTQRTGTTFEISMVSLESEFGTFNYTIKSGTISGDELLEKVTPFPIPAKAVGSGSVKEVVGPTDKVKDIFEVGAHVFFPADRREEPHWINRENRPIDPNADFSQKYTTTLSKPIVVKSALDIIKPWLYDVLLDRSVDPVYIINSASLEEAKRHALDSYIFQQSLSNINLILHAIFQNSEARLVRTHRGDGDKRLKVMIGNQVLLPSLDSMSAGQATLFSIFLTVLMYGDRGITAVAASAIKGCVVIDEIDAHLHGDLQYYVLPQLILLFPKVQFIVTTHSPLFALGMERAFGEQGVSILEAPSGDRITAERFIEFLKSFEYLKDTKLFSETLKKRISDAEGGIILCEGETDPAYIEAAIVALNLSRPPSIQIEWVGSRSIGGAQGGGISHLNDAYVFLKNNPNLIRRHVFLLYDSDAKKPDQDVGSLHVRSFPPNPKGKRKKGIENLLPDDAFSDDLYDEIVDAKNDDVVRISKLDKVRLCEKVCRSNDPHYFSLFESTLIEIFSKTLECN